MSLPGWVGTLIFSYIRRLGSFLGGKKFKFQYIWGFHKNECFGVMKILWIFFGGHHKNGLYLGVISMHFRIFRKVKVQNGGYCFGFLNFRTFLGCLKFLIFFGGER